MKRALLVTGGTPVSKSLVEKFSHEYIICADGGLQMLSDYHLVPHLVMGDMDSMTEEALQFMKEKNIPHRVFPCEKDGTDTELCLEELAGQGVKEIVILGGVGTRMDHTLANMYCLVKLYRQGILATIMDDNNEILYREKGVYLLERKDKKYFSILSYFPKTVYSTKGMKYEVDRLTLTWEAPGHGVSNEWIGDSAELEIVEGGAFLFKTKDGNR